MVTHGHKINSGAMIIIRCRIHDSTLKLVCNQFYYCDFWGSMIIVSLPDKRAMTPAAAQGVVPLLKVERSGA